MADTQTPAIDKATPDEVIARQRNRQVMVLAAIIAVLAGLVALSRFSAPGEVRLEPVPLAGDPAAWKVEDVSRIEISLAGKDALELVRGEGGWRLPARFNAPVDKALVETLLTRLHTAKRLPRPNTEDAAKFAIYFLSDDDAPQLKLLDASGKPVLHLMVGRNEGGTHDYVRLPGGPAGIFELTGNVSSWDNLFSQLKLDSDGRPAARLWLDLSGFRVLPQGARVSTMTIRDGYREIAFTRSADSGEQPVWDVARPLATSGESSAIQSIVSALENLSASDIAGPDTDAGPLGIEASTRRALIEYEHEGQTANAEIRFGTSRDAEVAIHVKAPGQGTLIYWVNNYILGRVFREPTEFLRRADVGLMPLGREPVRFRIQNRDSLLELRADGRAWKLLQPRESAADSGAVAAFRSRLGILREPQLGGTPDLAALGLDPAKATRWLEMMWLEKVTPPEGGEPADLERTATIYFGEAGPLGTPALVREHGRDDRVFLFGAESMEDLLPQPEDMVYFNVKVRHILISWKGKNDHVTPKDPERTEAAARELAAAIMQRARQGEDFVAMQHEYNEDSVADNVYDVTPESRFVDSFKKLAGRLDVGEVDICESEFGLHVMKRIE